MNVNITYDNMHQIMNEDKEREEREEREENTSDDNAGAGGEEDIPVPEILIKLRRGRSSSGTGQLVNVRGKFNIN